MNKQTATDFTLPPGVIGIPPDLDARPDAAPEVETFNDAELLGAETEGYTALLGQPATLLLGSLYGAKDRNNTQDGDWSPVTMPWVQWLIGGPGDKNNAPWGFTRHPVNKAKEGACVVLGSSIGKARKASAMETMYAMGLDIDAGFPLDSMLDKLEELGLFCLVYTSHSHGKSGLQLKHGDVIRKLKIKPAELDLSQVRRYLREFDKNRYEETFIQAVTIKTAKKHVKEGLVIELDTPPLDKYRLIFPLEQPVKLMDLADTESEWLALWEDKITGLARELLGVHFDTSCTDPSRLFFTARHPKDAADWYCAVVRGDPLRFEDVPTVKKSTYLNTRKPLNAFEMAGGVADAGDRPAQALAPSGASLNDWHSKAKDRFQMADLLEDLCADRLRPASNAQGQVHIECPFEHEHSSEGGTACDARNALDSSSGFWTWGCHHDSCQGRHKLAFLEEALRQNWFDEDQLFGDSVYMMDGPEYEDEGDDSAPAPADRTARHAVAAASTRDVLLSLVEGFDLDTTEAEVCAVIRQALETKADKAAQGRLKAAVTGKTPIKAKAYNDLWKQEAEAARKKQKPKGDSGAGEIETCNIKDHFPDQTEYARRRIREENEVSPRLFQFGGAYVTADAVRHRVRMAEGRESMFSTLEKVTRWETLVKFGDEYVPRLVSPPEAVVRALAMDHTFADSLPELLAVPSTPFFDAEGRLVAEDGYHEGAKVYLANGDLELPGVSRTPTPEEVSEAKRLIVEEVLADFPLGGMDRDQIVGTLTAPGPNDHAVTHAVAFALLPFCRDLIDGPTPGHMFTKPGPGTGASLLVDALTTLALGTPAPAMALPGKPDEIGKTLSATLAEGASVILFDNVGQAIASTELASAMTAPTYKARILGKSQTVEVPVRAVWAFTANNVTASSEVLRRQVLIPLDAGVPDPEKRTPGGGWRHASLRNWVKDNRPALVGACLTLVQNWVAGGMVKQKSAVMASYEEWAGIMGGILAAAGFHGFLDGQEVERKKAADDTADGLTQLLYAFAEYPTGTLFRPGGNRAFKGQKTVSIQALLNGEDRAKIEPGDDKPDPIQINGWGYSSFDGAYKTAGRITSGMKVFVRKPYQVEDQLLTFTELPDSRGGGVVYQMDKK
ncbi:hypothetical protein SAMN04488103_102438 [Gemmobacter aquatilis]|uniref:Uncharacterized protein n=1 Tax=Gemmobacter aquatilis TaxID=933059 RepID=A0A1H8C9N8_9RHOB|nr:hypothetical protein [Gemmobacter aquatilis]SEM91765.1 hypothetical protein SAMN04488103_102438 [Gemmobacter aquatilis]